MRQTIFDTLWGIKWLLVIIALISPAFTHTFSSYLFAILVIGLSILGWRDSPRRNSFILPRNELRYKGKDY